MGVSSFCRLAWFISCVEVVTCFGVFWSVHCKGGFEGVGFMAGEYLGRCYRLHWEIRSGCHLTGCWQWILRECEIFQRCSGGLLFCGTEKVYHVMRLKECASSLRCLAKLDLFLKATLCLIYRVVRGLPVCSIYALLQSGQVSLYTPNNENLSGAGLVCVSRFRIVLLVWNAVLKSV
jgi:hypothetical protein